MSLTNLNSFAFDNATFIANKAMLGGGLYIVDLVEHGNITNCFFINNEARKQTASTGFGGAMYLEQQSSLHTISSRLLVAATPHPQAQHLIITNSTFSNNTAYIGGAIYTKQFDFTLHNDTFRNNQAASGGALATELTNTASINYTIIINRCHFLSNDAKLYGASILPLRGGTILIDRHTDIVDGNQTYNTGAPAKIGLNAYNFTDQSIYDDPDRNITNLLAQGDLTLVYNSSANKSELLMTGVSSGSPFNLLLEFGVYDSDNNLLSELGADNGK